MDLCLSLLANALLRSTTTTFCSLILFSLQAFNTTFGAWPEVYLVVSASGTLLMRTEEEAGLGSLAGDDWGKQVRQVLRAGSE